MRSSIACLVIFASACRADPARTAEASKLPPRPAPAPAFGPPPARRPLSDARPADCFTSPDRLVVRHPGGGVEHRRIYTKGMQDPRADLAIEIVNCTDEDLVAWELHVGEGRDGGRSYEFTPPLEARSARTMTVTNVAPGKSGFWAVGRGPSGAPVESEITVVRLIDDAIEEAQLACKACEGTWGTFGLTGWHGCNCKTRDAGKPCADSLECESICLAGGGVEIADHNGPGGAARGFYKGTCAPNTINHGCKTHVPVGAASRGPLVLPLPRLWPMCSD